MQRLTFVGLYATTWEVYWKGFSCKRSPDHEWKDQNKNIKACSISMLCTLKQTQNRCMHLLHACILAIMCHCSIIFSRDTSSSGVLEVRNPGVPVPAITIKA